MRTILTSVLALAGCTEDAPADRPVADDSAPIVETGDDSSEPIVDADGDGSPVEEDCDDGNAAVNPNALESCNGIDDDCDGAVDVDAVDAVTRYVDGDGDGYGGGAGITTCDGAAGVEVGGDCDDARADVNPLACDDPFDGIDNDCSGVGDTELPVDYAITSADGPEHRFQTAVAGPTALRVISTNRAPRLDTRQVHFAATKPTLLVLNSAEDVEWLVDETVPGTITEILVVSEGAATVTGPKGTPVTDHTGTSSLFRHVTDWGSQEARYAEEALLTETGLAVTSWISVASFEEMTVSDATEWPVETFEYPNPACPSDVTPFGDPDTTAFPKECQSIVAKGGPICLTTSDRSTFLFTPDGESCEVMPTGIDVSGGPSASIAWRGEYVYGCGMENTDFQLVRVHLPDGALERSYRYCSAITDWDDQILAQDPDSAGFTLAIRGLTSWADVVSMKPVAPAMPGSVFYASIATRDDVLYTTWFSASEISSYSTTAPFDQFPDIILEDYHDWMEGVDVTDDDRIVLKGGSGMRVFDIDGSAITSFELPADTSGVSCFTP